MRKKRLEQWLRWEPYATRGRYWVLIQLQSNDGAVQVGVEPKWNHPLNRRCVYCLFCLCTFQRIEAQPSPDLMTLENAHVHTKHK